MNITLIISSLSCGGAERVMSIMANYWADRGNNITLITLSSNENDFYTLDSRIKRIGLDLMHNSTTRWEAIKNNYARLKRLRKAIRQSRANVVISFIDNINVMTLLAVTCMRMNVVISERIDPRQHYIGSLWNGLRRWLYPRTDSIVVQTTEVKDNWAAGIVSEEKIHVIPNPVESISETSVSDVSLIFKSPFIVAMGRLVPQKGFDILLKAFAQCSEQHEDWSLVILGEGPERKYLETCAQQLCIESRVHLPGRVQGPHIILEQAEIFVLSSRYEGFPNALLEAMSCGLPVISFDCPSGPGDIINQGDNGVLVPEEDVNSLADAMKRLMTDKAERQKLGKQAHTISKRFSVENVMGQWDALLKIATDR